MQPLKQMHLESLNLTLNSQLSKRDEWEGVCSAQRMLSQVRMTKRVSKGQLTSLYRCPKKIEPLAPLTVLIFVLTGLSDRTHYSMTGLAIVASGHSSSTTSFDCLNIFVAAQWLTAHVPVPLDRTRRSLDWTRAHPESSHE
jgi:hypothetical protein